MKVKAKNSLKEKFFSELRKHLKSPGVRKILKKKKYHKKKKDSKQRHKPVIIPTSVLPKQSFQVKVFRRAGEKLQNSLPKFWSTDEIKEKREKLIAYALRKNKIITASEVATLGTVKKNVQAACDTSDSDKEISSHIKSKEVLSDTTEDEGNPSQCSLANDLYVHCSSTESSQFSICSSTQTDLPDQHCKKQQENEFSSQMNEISPCKVSDGLTESKLYSKESLTSGNTNKEKSFKNVESTVDLETTLKKITPRGLSSPMFSNYSHNIDSHSSKETTLSSADSVKKNDDCGCHEVSNSGADLLVESLSKHIRNLPSKPDSSSSTVQNEYTGFSNTAEMTCSLSQPTTSRMKESFLLKSNHRSGKGIDEYDKTFQSRPILTAFPGKRKEERQMQTSYNCRSDKMARKFVEYQCSSDSDEGETLRRMKKIIKMQEKSMGFPPSAKGSFSGIHHEAMSFVPFSLSDSDSSPDLFFSKPFFRH